MSPMQTPPPRSQRAPLPTISATSDPDALLRLETVLTLVGQSKSALYRMLAAGAFPQQIRLGSRCVRWRAGDVTSWLRAQR